MEDKRINIFERIKILKKIFNIKHRKIILLFILIVIFSIIIFVIFKKNFLKKNEKDIPKLRVKIKQITKQDFSQKYTCTGTIKGRIENELRFEVDGVIMKYNYSVGSKISKGSIIAFLDTTELMSQLSYAKNKYESERAGYFSVLEKLKVYEELYKLKAISEAKLSEVRFEAESVRQRVATAMSEIEIVQKKISKTNLYAPSYGILAEIIIQAGEYVTPNDVVARFISLGDVNLEVEIPEKDIEQIKIGQSAKISCDAYPNEIFQGEVNEIAPIVKEKTRTVVVKIKIPNDEGKLRSGMFARGEILLFDAKDSITVPMDSIVKLSEETFLLPILKKKSDNIGEIELRHVKVSSILGSNAIISDGVAEGEYFVVETSGEISDGVVAEYIEEVSQQIQQNEF